ALTVPLEAFVMCVCSNHQI
ncbi:TPA: DUF1196 domain-containing protein, partial [Vibrio cholerae O1]|nr:DUF1196 domain-containing protein [Vibrio cholerae]HAS2380233.1 DUF1196 domain-containing protein [Vibrio cholerae O1]MVD21519.1 DUF1196 domain-containing protein [Vibrio cholerae]MVD33463.1 DUF1196 domain-containing protein [Vibrio cholerae]MVD63323.1 DUF1196 domain-containing protein [Vibrio cholerae]